MPAFTREGFWRVFRFALVGGSSTAAYFAILLLLRDTIPNTSVLAGTAYLICMALNYVGQSLFTFRAGKPNRAAAIRFSVMHLAALLFNAGAMGALVDGLGAPLLPAQVAVTLVVSASVYVVSARWVYR